MLPGKDHPRSPKPTTRRCWQAAVALVFVLPTALALTPRTLHAQVESRRASVDATLLGAGVNIALPAALSTGQSSGFSLGIEGGGTSWRWLGWLGAAWANEGSESWAVQHTELRARVGVGGRAVLGRGNFMLRVLGGATLVHEQRERHQSARLGDGSGALTSSALAAFPALDIEAGTALEIAGGWGIALFAGPSFHFGAPAGPVGWSGRVTVRRALPGGEP